MNGAPSGQSLRTGSGPGNVRPWRDPFFHGCLALSSTGIRYGLIIACAHALKSQLFDPMDPLTSGTKLGAVLGIGALATACPLTGAALDRLGMRRILQTSALAVLLGLGLALSARPEQGPASFVWVLTGFFFMGMGGGWVEAVVNPLVGALHPEDRVARMNRMHAWWPGGILMGGLAGAAVSAWGWDWRAMLSLAALPNLAMLVLLPGTDFPPTERQVRGISPSGMLRACLRLGFWLLCGAMAFTAVTELVPGPWIRRVLTRSLGLRGLWLVLGVAAMQFFLRRSQGLLRGLPPETILAASCFSAAAGLVCLSRATGPALGIAGALLWGAGACFLWPTMMVLTQERHPHSGALGLAVLATCGVLADFTAQPWFGALFDGLKVSAAGGAEAFATLGEAEADRVLLGAARESFWRLAAVPAVMVPLFLALRWGRRRQA